MRARSWGAPGWRPRPAAIVARIADTAQTAVETFRATCIHEAGHAVVGLRAFGLEVKCVWVNCSTNDGRCEFGRDGCGTWAWPRMVVTAAGNAAMRKAGLGDHEYRAHKDRRELEFYAQRDRELIMRAEEGAAGLVDRHWGDICKLADYLIARHGGSIDGPGIEALLSGRPVTATPAVTQTRALAPNRLIAKQIVTVKSGSREIAEIWECTENGARWFEVFELLSPKKQIGKRFATKAEAAKAIAAATARKAA
jgi:hypothetical protein